MGSAHAHMPFCDPLDGALATAASSGVKALPPRERKRWAVGAENTLR